MYNFGVCVCVATVRRLDNRGNLICQFRLLVSFLSPSATDVCEGIRADITLIFLVVSS